MQLLSVVQFLLLFSTTIAQVVDETNKNSNLIITCSFIGGLFAALLSQPFVNLNIYKRQEILDFSDRRMKTIVNLKRNVGVFEKLKRLATIPQNRPYWPK
jgi:hypothetical protein